MSDHDARALLMEALDFFNDHPRFSLRRDRRRNSYDLASRIDAFLARDKPALAVVATARERWETANLLRVDANALAVEQDDDGYWVRAWVRVSFASIGDVPKSEAERYAKALAALARVSFLMRLIETLAARRLYYRRSIPTLPDILLIEIPPHHAGASLALGRYYPVIHETLAELCEFEAYLCADRDEIVTPSLFDRRPSGLSGSDIVVARYAPPAAGWPWLLLCRWPPAFVTVAPTPDDDFARGTYTIDAFATAEAIDQAEQAMLATLGPAEIRHISTASDSLGRA